MRASIRGAKRRSTNNPQINSNKQDNASNGIEVKKRIDSNTTQDIYINEDGSVVKEGDIVESVKTKDNNGNVIEKRTTTRLSKVKISETFKNGKLDGEQIYDRSMNVNDPFDRGIVIKNWKNGVQDGLETHYYSEFSSAKELEQNWKNGEVDGPYLEQYRDGSIKETGEFKDGNNVGVWETFFRDGSISSIRVYDQSGRKQGKSKTWFSDGNIKSINNYIDGERAGKQESWYENGQKQSEKYVLKIGS